MSTKAKSLVKVGMVLTETFDGIPVCQFCYLVQKGAVVTLVIFGVTGPILITFAHDVATILPLNIFEVELPYSYSFRNVSLLNECHFANFAQNWLPGQRPLRNRKKRSRSIIYE